MTPCPTCAGPTYDGDGTCLGSSDDIAHGGCDNRHRCGTCGHSYSVHTAAGVGCAANGCRCGQLTMSVRFALVEATP